MKALTPLSRRHPPMRSIRYPELEVTGSPRAMDRAIGEALRDTIRAFSAVAIERVN
jgi:hypothetical protein